MRLRSRPRTSGRTCRGSRRGTCSRPPTRGRSPGSRAGGAAPTRARPRRRRSARRPRAARAANGSSSTTRPSATVSSGAAPTTTDARAAPASRTASVKSSCETPGASAPASAKSARSRGSALAGAERRRRERDREGGDRGGRGAEPRVGAAQRAPSRTRDGHRAEERRGEQREQDRAHRRSRRRSVSAASGSATTMPAMISARPEPADRAEPVAREPEAEDRGPDRLERERERRARGRQTPLRPDLHEVAERAREDACDEQRAPDDPAARELEVAERERDRREGGERGDHLDERERNRVVHPRVALHQRDLERVGGRPAEHEQVADGIADAHAREQTETDERERDARPQRPARAEAEEHVREQRREDDVEAGDEAGARDGRALEARGLERVAEREQQAERAGRPPDRAVTRAAATGASANDAIAKRTARNAKSG